MKLLCFIDKLKLKGMGFIALFAAILFFYSLVTKPYFKSSSDIKLITGHFKKYSFTTYSRGTSHLFWLKEYKNAFKISSDFWSNNKFNQESFYKLQYGDSIIISIHKSEHNFFERNDGYLLIYSINTPAINILTLDDAIEIYNGNLILYSSIGFCLVGIICLYFGYRKARNKN